MTNSLQGFDISVLLTGQYSMHAQMYPVVSKVYFVKWYQLQLKNCPVIIGFVGL